MINKRLFFRALPAIGLCILLCGIDDCLIKPPGPEGAGPGDRTYTCNPNIEGHVFIERFDSWTVYEGKELGGYIYAPSCAERPDYAPVIFFFHAFVADSPTHYGEFFKHLAGKDYIVIAPNYHTPDRGQDLASRLGFNEILLEIRNRGIKGASAGLDYYMNDLQVNPTQYQYGIPDPVFDPDGLVYGVAGHSMGGAITAAFSNPRIRDEVLGVGAFNENPKAVVMINAAGLDLFARCPGAFESAWCCPECALFQIMGRLGWVDNGYSVYNQHPNDWHPDPDRCFYRDPDGEGNGVYWPAEDLQECLATDGAVFWGDLSDITYEPLWIVMGSENDSSGGESGPLQLYCNATEISDKQYIRVLTDRHGQPFTNHLIAEHFDAAGADLLAPVWTGKVDAHDYWGYWKIVTAAMNCAVDNQDCNYATGGTEEQLSMGYWTDGQPVNPMQWNPRVSDFVGECHDLGDHNTPGTACYKIYNRDPNDHYRRDWNWRHPSVRANCPSQITLNIQGVGSGTVTHSLNPGVSCTTATSPCTWDFSAGVRPTLTATADAGSVFAGWGDDCASAGVGSCTITVHNHNDVAATFDLP